MEILKNKDTVKYSTEKQQPLLKKALLTKNASCLSRREGTGEFPATRFVNNIPIGLSKWGKYECVATCNLEKNKKNMWRIAECEYSYGTPGRTEESSVCRRIVTVRERM